MKFIIFIFAFVECLTISAQTDYRAVRQALTQVIHNHPEPICGDTIAFKLSSKFRKSPEMQTAIAQAYLNNKNVTKAITYLNKANAIEHDGKQGFSPALVLLGNIYRDNSKTDSAAVCYDRAITINPKNPEPYVNYAMMYATFGEKEKAIAKLEQMRTAIPTYNVDATIADVYTIAKDDNGAKDFLAGTDINTLRKDQVLRYAINLYEDRKYDEGIALLTKARTRWPGEKQVNRLLLWHCAAAHQYADAIANGKVFLDSTPEDSIWTIDYFALGCSYLLNTSPATGSATAQGLAYSTAIDSAFIAFDRCEHKNDAWDAAKKNIPSIFTAATKTLRDEKRYDEAIALMRRYITYRGDKATAFNYISVIQTLNAQLTDIDDQTRTITDAQPLLTACTDFIGRFRNDQNIDYVMFLKWRWLASFDKEMNYTALHEAQALYNCLKGIHDRDKGQNSRFIQVAHYLASYLWQKDYRTRAREYCREIIAIDPSDEMANKMLTK